MDRIFVSTPIGFEERTLMDMKAIWPYLLGKDAKTHSLSFPEVEIFQGGIEFETELFAALQLNFFLKTANRVLLRLTSFRVRDLPKFYNKFKSLPWREYLISSNVNWEVAAQKSRLNNEKRLQESAEKALVEILGSPSNGEPCAGIYIRMDDDLCTISLDTTGEHLHKRGWSVLKGEAPLRETIACFLLQEMIDEASPSELAQTTLFDPMMGSGTFLTEARALWSGQFSRSYAFQKWRKAPKLFLSASFALNYETNPKTVFKKFAGLDINQKMVEIASQNFSEVEKQLQQVQKTAFQKAEVEFLNRDGLKGEYAAQEPFWIILNPPYGERLPTSLKGGLKSLTGALCQKYAPNKLGILYPDSERIQAPEGYQLHKQLKINNGGIRCLFTVLTRM